MWLRQINRLPSYKFFSPKGLDENEPPKICREFYRLSGYIALCGYLNSVFKKNFERVRQRKPILKLDFFPVNLFI